MSFMHEGRQYILAPVASSTLPAKLFALLYQGKYQQRAH